MGGFEFTSCSSKKFERMAQETVDICLRMLKENNKSIDSTAIVSGTVYWLYIPYCLSGLLRTQFFWHNLSRNSCICITLYMSLMQQLYITGALKGHHLKGVYSPQDLYFPLTTLLAHPRWDLPVKCFTPMVSENKNTPKSRKSSFLGYYSSIH